MERVDKKSTSINFHQLKNYFKKINLNSNIEFCPIFNFDSLSPKINFNHEKKFCEGKFFKINRKYLSNFGFPAYGVHCNIWSKYKNSTIIHFAKRSKKLEKFPGLYDNPIAGGQPCNISIKKNLYKEGKEEAGLTQKNLVKAKKSKTIHYIHNYKSKLNSSIIFIYHLKNLNDLNFKNEDGEVDEFVSVEIENIYKILEKNLLKPNAIIPIIDFLILKESDFISKPAMLELNKIMKSYG